MNLARTPEILCGKRATPGLDLMTVAQQNTLFHLYLAPFQLYQLSVFRSPYSTVFLFMLTLEQVDANTEGLLVVENNIVTNIFTLITCPIDHKALKSGISFQTAVVEQ